MELSKTNDLLFESESRGGAPPDLNDDSSDNDSTYSDASNDSDAEENRRGDSDDDDDDEDVDDDDGGLGRYWVDSGRSSKAMLFVERCRFRFFFVYGLSCPLIFYWFWLVCCRLDAKYIPPESETKTSNLS